MTARHTTTIGGVSVSTDHWIGGRRLGGIWSFDFFCDVKNIAIKHGSFKEA